MQNSYKLIKEAGEVFLEELAELEARTGSFTWEDVTALIKNLAGQLSEDGVRYKDLFDYCMRLIDNGVEEAKQQRAA